MIATETITLTETQNVSTQSTSVGEKTNEFEPTPTMIKWRDATAKLGLNGKIKRIAELAGVDRGSWYSWQNNPGFRTWWDAWWTEYSKSMGYKLYQIGFEQAKTNYDYWHDMMLSVGNLIPPDQRTINNNTVNTQYNLPDDVVNRLEKS